MKPKAFEHPKTERFADELGIRLREAWGMLDRLVALAAQYAERGNICSVFTDAQLARRLDWVGDGETPEALIRALDLAGFLDRHPVHGHVIHDWPEHAPDYTKRRVKGSEEGWAVDDVPESSGCSADRGPGASPEDSEINAALPSSTIPLPSPPYISVADGAHASNEEASGDELEDRSRNRRSGSGLPPPDWAIAEARHLGQLLHARLPGAAVPKSQAGWQSWARAIASIGAPPKQVIFAIAWLYGPENEGEFRLEVRSGKALRKKWGGVLAGMQRAAARRDRVNTPSTKLDIIADEVRKSEERDYVRQAIDHDEFQRRTKSEAQSISRALCSLPGRGFSDQVE